eukprot:g7393.t1
MMSASVRIVIATLCFVFGANTAVGSTAISFVSIGDWGGAALEDYHKTDEITVAKSFAASAAALQAQFVLNTGDNFYYYGVKSTTDPMWENTFEQIYNQDSLMVPWYGVLGNHDYGFNPIAQTQYKSPNNDRWYLPSLYYTKRIELGNSGQYLTLIMIDSSPCVSDYRGTDQAKWDPCGTEYPGPTDCVFHENILKQNCTAQYKWLESAIQKIPSDDWVIAVGHHPADEIDVADLTTLLQQAKVDLYLNGHTHELAQYEVDGNSAYITTGAGCMVSVADTEHAEDDHNHAEKLRQKKFSNLASDSLRMQGKFFYKDLGKFTVSRRTGQLEFIPSKSFLDKVFNEWEESQ